MGQFSFSRPVLTFPKEDGCIKMYVLNSPSVDYRPRKKTASALQWRPAMLLLAFLLFSTTAFAQDLPPESRCTSKDLELVSAKLDLPKCYTCDPDDEVTAPLVLGIANKTGSTRTSFAFWGTLTITDSDGNVTETEVTGCNGPIIRNATTELPFLVNGEEITFECGSTLQLTDLFLAWTDASPKSTCATLQPSLIAPKCGTLPVIDIATSLAVSGQVTNGSCGGGNTGAINLTISGGKAPYTINWADLPGTNNPEDRTNLAAGPYSVTVTDANGCTKTENFTITQPPAVSRPAVTIVEPSLCGSPTGTVTVTSPLGSDFEYSNGGTTWQNSTTFTIAAGAGFSIFVRSKTSGCSSPATNCSNYTSSSAAVESPNPVSAVQATQAVQVATAAKAPAATKLAAKANTEMMAYPIPFTQRTTLAFKSVTDESYVINLYDLNGNLLKQIKAGKAKAGETINVEVDGTRLPESMYLVRKISKTGVSTVKLLKKR